MSVNVRIIEDHTVMLRGMIAILHSSDDVRVRAAAPTASALVAASPGLDVVILALNLIDGSTPAENMRRLKPLGARVIVHAPDAQPYLLREAMQAGALGALPRTADASQTIAAVRRASAGHAIPGAAHSTTRVGAPSSDPIALSARESQVLALYASGRTATQVAQRLHVAPATVIEHIRNIRAKYVIVDRAAPTKVDLFLRAVEDGLISPGARIAADHSPDAPLSAMHRASSAEERSRADRLALSR
ncbi:LuxR C-terminal-related transcriptional regulator [Microbacterium saperdae]